MMSDLENVAASTALKIALSMTPSNAPSALLCACICEVNPCPKSGERSLPEECERSFCDLTSGRLGLLRSRECLSACAGGLSGRSSNLEGRRRSDFLCSAADRGCLPRSDRSRASLLAAAPGLGDCPPPRLCREESACSRPLLCSISSRGEATCSRPLLCSDATPPVPDLSARLRPVGLPTP